MKFGRVMTVLVVLTLAMQVIILYKMSREERPQVDTPTAVRAANKDTFIQLTGLPIKGESDAKIALVEFSDYECPFCAKHAATSGKDIQSQYVLTGKLAYAYVNNPLPIHQAARFLATAAICAGAQGHYWQMHDSLFRKTPNTVQEVAAIAEEMDLDVTEFEACVTESPTPGKVIERDLETAKRLGLKGTPSFAVGPVDGQGIVTVSQFIIGAQPIAVFEQAINEVLGEPLK